MSQEQTNKTNEEANINQTETAAELSPLDVAKNEAEKWKNDYLYLRAEFENYRRHAIKERSDLSKYGAERFLTDFVEVMDNLDRALLLQPTPEAFDSYVLGVQMIAKEIKAVMQKHGVSTEDCLSQAFDPVKHEALGTEPTDKVNAGHISRVLRSPYRLHDKLIRPAQVIVATELPKN